MYMYMFSIVFFSILTESLSLEWLTTALTTADQLLLKGLKTMCELSLATICECHNITHVRVVTVHVRVVTVHVRVVTVHLRVFIFHFSNIG